MKISVFEVRRSLWSQLWALKTIKVAEQIIFLKEGEKLKVGKRSLEKSICSRALRLGNLVFNS